MPRAVLFDLDGVLIDSLEAWLATARALARELGEPEVPRDRFVASFGQSTAADAAAFFAGRPAAEIDAFYLRLFPAHAGLVRVAPDAAPTLAALAARGLRTAVVTNTVAPLARALLEAAGLAPDTLAGAGDGLPPKPAPDLVLHACATLGVKPAEALLVGDSVYDRDAAAAAGVRFVGKGLPGDERVAALAELPALVDRLAGRADPARGR